MLFHRWLQNVHFALAPRRAQRHRRRRGALRAATLPPSLEVLEDRCLLSFSPAVTYDVNGVSPQAVVTADFNNDGQLDLATANLYDDTVSVLLGNADGTFQPAQSSATGGYPFSLAAGDFNADGKLDLATANYNGGINNDVSILLGNGDGTFAAPVGLYATEVYAWSIATGDLNADGNLDLVVTSDDEYSVGYVSVLLGQGDGTFAAAETYGPYDKQIFTPVLTDLSGDGQVDVAVASWQTNSVKVFLGNGEGTLQEPSDFATAVFPNSVTAGDFNGDGHVDLATANPSTVSLLLGNGNGTFQTARSFAAGSYPQSATASDVNGDGKLDLVVTNPDGADFRSDGDVSVLLGNGDGSLAPPITTATGGTVTVSVVMGDFNSDGRPDAATANALSNTISVLLNDGVWDSTPPPPPPPPPPQPSITITDVTKSEGRKGSTTFTFSVTLSAPSTETVTVYYATADGTALISGNDYKAKSGTLTFKPGETTKTITISVRGDRKAEMDETFYVDLFSASNATIEDARGVGTILNDDGGTQALETAFSDPTLIEEVQTEKRRR